MKKIIIDPFGSDSPDKLLSGIANCVKNDEVRLCVCGQREYIEEKMTSFGAALGGFDIIDAPEVITNDEDPSKAVMMKRDSSLVTAMKKAKADSEVIGVITAGSTGAALLSSAAFLTRQKGIAFPALATFLPNSKGSCSVLLDCGANVDMRPEQMKQFALMGTALAESCLGIEKASVGVISVGTEDKKGNSFSKAVFAILSETDINFSGNIEAREALSGRVDVMVCDGFTGNVLLKGTEGAAMFVMEKMIRSLSKNLPEGVGTEFIKKCVGEVMAQIDFSSMGGAMILGVAKPVIKAHGNSNETTIDGCIRQLLGISRGGYIEKISEKLELI